MLINNQYESRSELRIDAVGKVTGGAPYPGDVTPAALLHAKVVFSGQPHARMLAMDISQAEAVPGVVAIFTAKDVPVNEYGLIMPDQPVMVGLGSQRPYSDISLWEGDHVAIVVAESEKIATQASEQIDIAWEQLPVVDDVFEAMQDKVILNQFYDSNILKHFKIRKGDMAAGWAAADVIIEGSYHCRIRNTPICSRKRASVGSMRTAVSPSMLADSGRLKNRNRSPMPWPCRMDKVRVQYVAIGGAFGGREDMSIQIVLALAVKRLHERGIERPVRIIWSREDSIRGHHKRHPAWIKTKWGATKEGKITAVAAEVITNSGAYAYTSTKVLGNAASDGHWPIRNSRMPISTATPSRPTTCPAAPSVGLAGRKVHLLPKTR